MPGRGRNEVISIKISVPFANAIEGALCVDAISTHCIFLPESSLWCTRAPHFLQASVLPDLPEALASAVQLALVGFLFYFLLIIFACIPLFLCNC